MKNKTCRMIAEFAEENKMFNFFKKKNNSLKKIKKLLAKFSH